MGILQSKKMKNKEKHPINKDIKIGTTKEAPTKEVSDFNHGKANTLTGNLNNTAVDVSAVRVTQQHTSPAKPKDGKTSTPKPMLQQETPVRPTAGPCCGVKITAGEFDALRSDKLQLVQDVSEKLSQQQSRHAAQVEQQKKTTVPVEKQENRQVMYGHAQHEKSKNFTPSQQRPAAKETTEVPLQTTTTKPGIAEVPAAKPTEPPDHSAQVSNQSEAHVNNEEDALHEQCLHQNSVTNMIVVDYLYFFRAKSEISRANATKMRLRQKLAKSGRKKLKAQPEDGRTSSQQTAEETVTAVQESSQQQGCTAMEENTIKKHTEPHQIPQPNKADNDTNGNTSSCIQKVTVKALAPQVPVVEGMPTAATHNPNTAAIDTSVKLGLQHEYKVSFPQDNAVKPKKKCTFKALNQNQPNNNTRNVTMKEEINGKNGQVEKEKQEPEINPAVPPENKVRAEGCWQPFTVNQSCPRKVYRQHDPGTGLPQNVQNWPNECPNHLCEPPWVTAARFAACLALTNTLEEEGDSHQ